MPVAVDGPILASQFNELRAALLERVLAIGLTTTTIGLPGFYVIFPDDVTVDSPCLYSQINALKWAAYQLYAHGAPSGLGYASYTPMAPGNSGVGAPDWVDPGGGCNEYTGLLASQMNLLYDSINNLNWIGVRSSQPTSETRLSNDSYAACRASGPGTAYTPYGGQRYETGPGDPDFIWIIYRQLGTFPTSGIQSGLPITDAHVMCMGGATPAGGVAISVVRSGYAIGSGVMPSGGPYYWVDATVDPAAIEIGADTPVEIWSSADVAASCPALDTWDDVMNLYSYWSVAEAFWLIVKPTFEYHA
jgi:hypothetical protein